MKTKTHSTKLICTIVALLLLIGNAHQIFAQASSDGDSERSGTFAVVRAQGADLLDDANGTTRGSILVGALVIATARSNADDLLFVQSEGDGSGWVAASALLIANSADLPQKTPSFRASGSSDAGTASASAAPDGISTMTANNGASTVSANNVGPNNASQNNASPNDVMGKVNLQNNNLNLRAGPGTNYPVVNSAAPDSGWYILGQNSDGSWVQISAMSANGPSGTFWASASYLSISGALQRVATISEVAPPPVQSQPVQSQPPAPAVASPPAANNAGVFGLTGTVALQDRNGGTIHVYRFATGELTAITQGIDPAISPDGSQIAFTRDGAHGGLFLINADGSNERRIFGEGSFLRSAKWSPDGTKIIFSRANGFDSCRVLNGSVCQPDERIIDSLPPEIQQGVNVERLLQDENVNSEYFYSLARVATDGGDYRDIPGMLKAQAPDWAEGGIVYQSEVGIQVTADRGDARSQVIAFDPNRRYFHDPDWQPNGGRIVFQRKLGGHWQIFTVNSDGAGLNSLTRPLTALVDELPSNASPAWSPDGQHIIYVSNRNSIESAGAWHFWVMDADGGGQRRLPIDVPIEYSYSSEQMVSWGR